MKIAFATNGEELKADLDPHFGRAANYLIYDLDTGKVEVYPNPELSGKEELPPDFLRRMGVKAVVVISLGPRALNKFQEFGIEIYQAVPGSIIDNIKKIKEHALSQFEE